MLKSEQEIQAPWGESVAVLVSIICFTFNHEPYIRDAINSLLMQETNFPFEIVIHDDASTDATASIAKSIADLYPNIVKLVAQKENQYSQGKKINVIAFGFTIGKYIAFCDGDDYWTNPQKLQIQIDEMARHPECDISFHPAMCIDAEGRSPPREICKHANITCVMPAEEVILNGGGYMPTASLMVKRKVLEELPHWFSQVPFGDYFIQCLASFNAGALYINNVMSVYRVNVLGSWSANNSDKNKFHADVIVKIIGCCHLLDNSSGFQFTRTIHACVGRYYLSLCCRSVVNFRFLRALVYASKGICSFVWLHRGKLRAGSIDKH
jgi:glycosyltransferase involved in cell wall biosynthesis